MSQSNEVQEIASNQATAYKWWKGNFNVWLLLSSFLLIWFTIGKGLPILDNKMENHNLKNRQIPLGPWFGIHIISVAFVSMICIWNLYHSPNHGPIYRTVHIWLGRVAMVFGYAGVISGFITTFYERYEGTFDASRIGLIVAGIAQLVTQVIGHLKIRPSLLGLKWKKDVQAHAGWMHGLFYGACLIPALIRIPQMFGFQLNVWPTFGWVFGIFVQILAFRAFTNKSLI
jgi:hypothetical protein